MHDWKKVRLEEICLFKTGKLNSNAAMKTGKYPFFTCDPETLCINNFAFDQEAIILAGNNAEGNFTIKYFNGKFNAYQRTYIISSTTNNLNLKYLFYSLKICLNELKKISQGTSTKFLTKSILNNFVVNLPPLYEQRAIADVLSSFDDKIELNNKIIKNIEEQAQTLYKHWFVDFEFPNGFDKPYKSNGGTFKDSSLGQIPTHWEIKELGEFFPIMTGKKNANESIKNGKYLFFSCSQESLLCDNFSFDGSAILVAGNGDFSVKVYKGKFEAYQRTYVLIPYDSNLLGILYYIVTNNLDEITSGHRGSVIKFITKGSIENFKIAMPNKLTEQFSKSFLTIIENKLKTDTENQKLAKMRDYLLPKLMSGTISVEIRNNLSVLDNDKQDSKYKFKVACRGSRSDETQKKIIEGFLDGTNQKK